MNYLKKYLNFQTGAKLIVLFFLIMGIWHLRPLTTRLSLSGLAFGDKQILGCTAIVGATLFTNLDILKPNEKPYVDAGIVRDQTTLEVKIEDKQLIVQIDPELTKGARPPKSWTITRNTADYIVAQGMDKNEYNEAASSFAISKKTGLAVWTKSEPTVLNSTLPNATAHYFECR